MPTFPDFILQPVSLPLDLQRKIVRAHHAGVSPKKIARFLKLPLSQVRHAIFEDEQRQVELAQWQAVIGEQLGANEP